MEKLTVLALLWHFGLGNKQDYCALLDSIFLKAPKDELLLELENRTGDSAETVALLYDLPDGTLDRFEFGRELFTRLEAFLDSGVMPQQEFAERCFGLWDELPKQILRMKDPFDTLFYAHEMSDDSKKQRDFLQYAFDYYKEKP